MKLTPAEEATYLKYAELPLPRHTSYPSVPSWTNPWSPLDYEAALAGLGASGQQLGLYVHIPFCRQLCAYCACTREIVPDDQRALRDPAEDLLAGLAAEGRHVAAALGKRLVHDIHLGGGTPTFLTPPQLARLFEALTANFILAPDVEMSAEIDPRVTSSQQLRTLRGLGFQRLSLGIQDFDPTVQAAVGRIQSEETVRRVVYEARTLGFRSINFDLIYGLPWQTEVSLSATLDKVLALKPDRVAFYRLAVLPDLFKWQRTFTRADLPRGLASRRLMQLAISRFEAAGYLYLGLDHFALPEDSLAKAFAKGEVTRSFQGMADGRGRATLALGPSGITQSDLFFSQSDKTTKVWRGAVANGLSAVRGHLLTAEDRLRRAVLEELYTSGAIDLAAFRATHGEDFVRHFALQSSAFAELQDEGLITLTGDRLALTPNLGRLLVRVVAASLDSYLPRDAWHRGIAVGQASATG